MVWQKIDDQFGISRKVIRIPKRNRLAAIGLWTLAGNYSVRALTDGALEQHELDELGAPAGIIAELVRVDLWHGHGHECVRCLPAPVGGVIIHDFLHYNPSKAKVLEEREAERVRKVSQRDKARTPSGTPGGSDAVSGHPVPSPGPDPIDVTTDTESSQVPERASSGPDLVLLERVVGEPVSPRAAIELVQAITSKSKHQVRDVNAYIATVCRKSPAEVQQAYFDLDLGSVA